MAGENNSNLQKNEQNKLNNAIIFTVFKTMVYVFGFFMLILGIFVAIFPRVGVKILPAFNMKGGTVLSYEKIYLDTNKTSDLYNLINATIDANKDDMTYRCIEHMQSKDDYNEFCTKVDARTKQVTSKKYYAFVGNLDAYYNSQKVEALSKGLKEENLEKAMNIAKEELAVSSNPYTFSFEAYITEAVKSETHKDKHIKIIMSSKCGESDITVAEAIENKIQILEQIEEDSYDKILATYTLMKIEKAKYLVYSNMSTAEEELANNALARLDELQIEYNNLIK